MTLNKLKKRKFKGLIALTSAMAIVISNAFPISYANENNGIGEEELSGGIIAEAYIPENAKLDEDGNVVYDEDGNFILLNEEGEEIPKEILKEYEMSWDEESPIVYDLRKISNKSALSRAVQNKVANLKSKNINIRSTAEIKDGNVIGSLPSGKIADITGESGDWWKVKYGSTTGYVLRNSVYQLGAQSDNIVKSITDVNIRSGASTSNSKIGTMSEGSTAEAVEVDGNWMKVIYGSTIGWVNRDYVKYVNPSLGQSIAMTSGGLNSTIYFKDGPKNYKHQTSDYIKDASGRHVYCLDSEKWSPNGHPYSRIGQADDITYRILKNGYPNKSLTGDATTDRIITQAALWGYVDKANVKINDLVAVKDGAVNAEMLNHAKSLYNTGINGKEAQTVSIKFSTTALNAKLNGNEFETDYLTMIGEGDIKSSKITIKAYDVNTGVQNTSVQLKDENNKVITEVKVGQKFKVVIPKTVPVGKIKLQASGDLSHDIAVKYSSNLANVQNTVLIEEAIETKKATNELVIDWNAAGKIKITKVDSVSKKNLAGAVYVIKDASGKEVAKLTTDSNGQATTGDLVIGKYSIQEQSAPEGYVIDTKVYNVELTDTTTKSYEFTNDKIVGSVKIIKKDVDSKKTLEGAEFTLYDANGGMVSQAATNKNGEVEFKQIPYGSYVIKETKAPIGYVKTDSDIKIEIKTNGQVIEKEVFNRKAGGTLDFEKTDVATGEVIEGAKIKIRGLEEKNKDINFEFESKKEGNRFELPVGKYEITETIAPEGYVLSEEVQTFEIKENGEVVKAKLTNKHVQGDIKIIKKDGDSKKTLEGAEFTLYDANGGMVSKATSNKNGEVEFKQIPYGSYVIKETKAPIDYVKTDSDIKIEIKTNGQVIEKEVFNRKAGGTLDFEKTDVATGEIIEGAKITIRGLEEKNKDINFEFESKKEGNRFELPVGRYEITETIAPEGYVLSEEVQTFEIKGNGEVVKAQLKNKYIHGNIKITKVDADSGQEKTLEGAKFQLINKAGEKVVESTTDENGVISFNNIPYGEYIVREVEAPKGYVLSGIDEKVVINEDGKTIELKIKNSKAIGEVIVSKVDADTGALVAGAKMCIAGNEESNKDFKIEFTSTDNESQSFKLPVGKYVLTEIESPEGFVLSSEPMEFEITEQGKVIELKFENKPIKAAVEILKVDGEDETKVLQGAEFTLYDAEGKELSKAVTDEQGIARFENLLYGKYTAKETVSPTDYVLTDKVLEINVNKDGEVIKFTFTNDKAAGEVDFSKVDVTTSEVLEGAKIEITGIEEKNKDVKIEFISSKEGNRFKLPIGKYEFKEIAAPEGFILTTEVGNFEIKENGEIVKAKLENAPILGSVEIIKVDAETGETLQGAEFVLLNSESKELEKGTVNEDGVLVFENLRYGAYKVKELVAPQGYILTPEVKNFEIKNNGEIVKIVVENTKEPVIMKGSIEITKVDANKNDMVLSGAEFSLYNDKDEELAKGTTNKEGKILFEDLDLGVYYIKETKAPENYQINETPTKVVVDEDGVVVKVTITNAQKLAQTGGNFTTTNMIFIGFVLVGVALILSNEERRTLK